MLKGAATRLDDIDDLDPAADSTKSIDAHALQTVRQGQGELVDVQLHRRRDTLCQALPYRLEISILRQRI